MARSSIAELIRRGEPLSDTWVVDAHAHYGHFTGFYVPGDPCAPGMIRQMDRIGVNVACISTHAALSADVSFGNDIMFRTVAEYPDRFYGYVVVHPGWPEKAAADLARAEKHPNVIGVKIHPDGHNCRADDPRYERAFAWPAERGLMLLAHSGKNSAPQFAQWLEKHPTLTVILGHAGSDAHAEVVRKYPNAYAETCGTTGCNWWPEEIVAACGVDKVLWGSDFPFHDARNEIGRIGLANLDDEVKAKVLGGNMARLLRAAGFRAPG
ncbi:MAG: amidohydrolase family protein [Armatimonadetes bacterium]|nr:amidohydrolase family protein [Armatimonadota bacterium]